MSNLPARTRRAMRSLLPAASDRHIVFPSFPTAPELRRAPLYMNRHSERNPTRTRWTFRFVPQSHSYKYLGAQSSRRALVRADALNSMRSFDLIQKQRGTVGLGAGSDEPTLCGTIGRYSIDILDVSQSVSQLS